MSPGTDLRIAVAALVAGAAGVAGAVAVPGAPAVAVVSEVVVPGLLAVAGAGALLHRGAVGHRAAILALVLGGAALLCGLGARASWSAGWDEAEAGTQQGPLAAAWFPLVVLGWALDTAAIAPVLAPLFRDVRSRWARALLAAFVAGVVAFALGIALGLPGFGVAASIAVLFLLTWRREARQPASAAPAEPWPARASAALLIVTAVCGAAALAVAFTGAAWPGSRGDGTLAMNVGLALAGVSAVPLLVAGGAALRSLPRYRRSAAPAFAVAAVLTGSASQAAGAGGALQQPLLLAGALLAGVGGALIALPALPPFGAWQPVVFTAFAIGLAATAGFAAVVAVPVVAPVVAVIGLVVLRWRGSTALLSGGRSERPRSAA